MLVTARRQQRYEDIEDQEQAIEDLLAKRAERIGIPLGNFISGVQLYGRSRDPAISRNLDSNEQNESEATWEMSSEVYKPCLVDKIGLEAPCGQRVTYSRNRRGGYSELLVREVIGRSKTVETWEDEKTKKRRYKYIVEPKSSAQRLNLILRSAAIQHIGTLLKAERRARKKLRTMLDDGQALSYEVEGCFFERGASGVIYLLRRGRPLIALREKKIKDRTYVRFLAALCLHAHSYCANSFVGTLPPSDDVIAQLLLIRSDEHELWKRSSQKSLHDPTSGI
jgi:hypothetical protein